MAQTVIRHNILLLPARDGTMVGWIVCCRRREAIINREMRNCRELIYGTCFVAGMVPWYIIA